MVRTVAAVTLVLSLVGAAGARGATRADGAPLALGDMVESFGGPALGSAPGSGQLLRFLPNRRFAIGVLLENASRDRLEIVDARVLEPGRTLVHQIGTRFHPWNPPKCPPGAPCPAYGFPLHADAARPRPFAVAPGRDVGVELDFRLGPCGQIRSANPAPIARVRVIFRTPGGRGGETVLRLAGAELHLRMPKPEDCVQPHSALSVDGPQPFATSWDWTVPGSPGDVCTLRRGALAFRSRTYRFPNSPAEWVELRLPGFAGRRSYRDGRLSLVAAGKPVFRSRRAFVEVTRATAREVVARIDAGRPLPPNGARRMPFQVSGTLRCRVVRG